MSPDKLKNHYTIVTVLVERNGPAVDAEVAKDLLIHKLRSIQITNPDLNFTLVTKKDGNTGFEPVIP
jgi:hypothetical protein